MVDSATETRDWEGHPAAGGPVPEFVDWILGACLAVAGMLSLIGGGATLFLVDRALLVEGIEDEAVTVTIGTTELTDAEAVTVAEALISWTGIGLVVTGFGMLLVAVWYVVSRRRAHRRAGDGERVSSYTSFAALGAAATVLLSFVPLSPALGGAIAGYLERKESERTVSVGTLAGVLPIVPLLVLIAFVLVGLVVGLLAVDQSAAAVVTGLAMFFAILLMATMSAALGAIGGYLGGRLADRQTTST